MLFGTCIGCGPAMEIAAVMDVAGLALVAPFLSLNTLLRNHARALAAITPEQIANVKLAPQIRCPTFIFHGKQDKIVPLAHSEKLCQLLTCRRKLVCPDGIGHRTCLTKDE